MKTRIVLFCAIIVSLFSSEHFVSASASSPSMIPFSNSVNLNSQGGILNAKFVMGNGSLDCNAIASQLNGIPISNDKVCDVILVRQNPHNTLNSFIEFQALSANTTNDTTQSHQVFVKGDFALLENEVKEVQTMATNNGWIVTGVHNPLSSSIPAVTLMHWEIQNDINKIIDQIDQTLAMTSIKPQV